MHTIYLLVQRYQIVDYKILLQRLFWEADANIYI